MTTASDSVTIAPDFQMAYHVGTTPEVKYMAFSPDEGAVSINGALKLYFDDVPSLERLIEALEATRAKMTEDAKLYETYLAE